MRAILVAQGDIVIPPESYVLGALIKEYRIMNFIPWRILSRLVISKFASHPEFPTWEFNVAPLYQKALTLGNERRNLASLIELIYHTYGDENLGGGSRWGDKTPLNTYHLSEIHKVFPNAFYIHMIRDGRDVVSSYLKSGIYSDLGEACQRWSESIDLARNFAQKIQKSHYIEVRYEALVSDPEPTIKSICKFLGVPYNDEMMKPEVVASLLGDTGRLHHEGVHRPINTDSIGKWKTRLSPERQKEAEILLRHKLIQLEYEKD